MGTFGSTWKAIRGKEGFTSFFSRNLTKSLWGKTTTLDYTRNDYDLYRSLYFGAAINGKGKDMQIGAMFAKPIVNSAAGFAIGDGFTITLEDEYADAQQAINDWLKDNHASILDVFRHQLRDGDSYIYVDEFGKLDEFDAKDVEIMLDPMTGEIVGYDVNELYEEVDPANGNTQKWNLLRQYRTDSVRYLKYKDSQREDAQVIYDRVFTVDGSVEPNENQEYFATDIIPRALPVVHFANDPEPRAVYGNSELLNCLQGILNYTAVAANATKGVIYNAMPVPYITGVTDEEKVNKNSNKGGDSDDDDNKANWGPDTVLYFGDKDAKAGFLQANGFMSDVGQLLEYYFYLIVQASETPEFIFGTAIQGSKASVSEQMPIVTQKAERKRAQLYTPLKQLIEAYVDRKIRMSDPVFLKLKNKELNLDINFPELVGDDKKLVLETVKAWLTEGIITEESAIRLTLGDKIPDIDEEIKKAHDQAETKIEKSNVVPFEGNRLADELDSADEDENEDEEPTPNTEE
jgi:hypothetical protein